MIGKECKIKIKYELDKNNKTFIHSDAIYNSWNFFDGGSIYNRKSISNIGSDNGFDVHDLWIVRK